MSKAYTDRKQQGANRRKKHHEQALQRRNDYGAKDLTAYNAVKRIRTGGNTAIVIK